APASAADRGARVRALVGRYAHACGGDVETSVRGVRPPHDVGFWLTPHCGYEPVASAVARARLAWPEPAPRCCELGETLGDTYVALGVLQAVAACAWLTDQSDAVAVATCGAAWGDDTVSVRFDGRNASRVP